MNISQYIIYIPYRAAWTFLHAFRRKKQVHFYCGSQVDHVVMKSIIRHFPQAVIVAKNKKVKKVFDHLGIPCKVYPTFPDVLVMPRHTARKYPEPRIKKIGLRHGAYHFKDFVAADRYHAFDVYLVTSQKEVQLAREKGIKNTVAVGFPKLDPAFDGSLSAGDTENLKKKLALETDKPVVLFTTTWDKSGMSAIDIWIDRLQELTGDYNVLVTVHHWTNKSYKNRLKKMPFIHFIEEKDIVPYLMLADVMVADMSSIIAEFCALDKPVITITTGQGKRSSQEIIDMLKKISARVESFEELHKALKESLQHPKRLSGQRQKYNMIMFDKLDGRAGQRAAAVIRKYTD